MSGEIYRGFDPKKLAFRTDPLLGPPENPRFEKVQKNHVYSPCKKSHYPQKPRKHVSLPSPLHNKLLFYDKSPRIGKKTSKKSENAKNRVAKWPLFLRLQPMQKKHTSTAHAKNAIYRSKFGIFDQNSRFMSLFTVFEPFQHKKVTFFTFFFISFEVFYEIWLFFSEKCRELPEICPFFTTFFHVRSMNFAKFTFFFRQKIKIISFRLRIDIFLISTNRAMGPSRNFVLPYPYLALPIPSAYFLPLFQFISAEKGHFLAFSRIFGPQKTPQNFDFLSHFFIGYSYK